MPPKKIYSTDSISISSTSSRVRSNVAADLITKSEAALSSQASVYTQRTNASQQAPMNFGMAQNDDMEFNRDQIAQVFITRQQEDVIQKILQLARKGKVNSKNAFQVPIKVVHSQTNSSINNKFWKFASQLLDASMYIYDKRVQNMYVSIGAFQNKLSRIGFNIKDRKAQQSDRQDDVNLQQQMIREKNRQQRQMMLKISADEFSGLLNLDDSEIIGYETIQKKEKLDIKNIENKFIADPTFEKTQKLFDSFSLKSLMLNIFNLSSQLNVGLFHKSDLQQDTKQYYEQNNTFTSQNMFKKKRRSQQQEFSRSELNIDKQTQSQGQSQCTQSVNHNNSQQQGAKTQSNRNNNNTQGNINFSYSYNNNNNTTILSQQFQDYIQTSKHIIKQQSLFQQISNFISKQPQLKQDYLQRQQKRNTNINNSRNYSFQEPQQQQQVQKDPINITYGQIIQKQRMQFIELFKQFQSSMEQGFTNNDNTNNNDFNNCSGLYDIHQTQSQHFQPQQQSQFLKHFTNPISNDDQLSTNSMPVTFQESFFSWDQQHNIIEPIMPWEIQFKNLKLTKKRKKPQRGQSKRSKKSNKQSNVAIVQFQQLQILDRKQILKQKDIKKKFYATKQPRKKYYELNCQPKQFDIVHAEYHHKSSSNNSRITGIAQRQSFRKSTQISQSQPISDHQPSFVFDLDDSVHPQFVKIKKQQSQQETRLYDGESYSGLDGMGFFHSDVSNSKGTSYFSHSIGVNNIREIKKIIVNEVNEKGWTSLQEMNKLMTVLSPQQLFTIFLHLTNENQFQISADNDGEQINVILSLSKTNNRINDDDGRERRNNLKNQYDEIEI